MRNAGEKLMRLSATAALLVALMLSFFILTFRVQAAGSAVNDSAGLFTQKEAQKLESACDDFSDEYGFDIFILTADNDMVGTSTDSANRRYIENYMDENYPDGAVGILLNEEYRYYYIDVAGNVPLNIYTDSRQEQLEEDVVSYLRDDEWYQAADTFVSEAGQYAYDAKMNDDLSDYTDYENGSTGGAGAAPWIIPAVIAAIVALIMTGVQLSRHNETKMARDASGYVVPGSSRIDTRQDMFMTQYVTKTPIVHDDNSGSPGGGTSVHTSSGGHSHSGGGGHF